jgi:hypothetical protein
MLTVSYMWQPVTGHAHWAHKSILKHPEFSHWFHVSQCLSCRQPALCTSIVNIISHQFEIHLSPPESRADSCTSTVLCWKILYCFSPTYSAATSFSPAAEMPSGVPTGNIRCLLKRIEVVSWLNGCSRPGLPNLFLRTRAQTAYKFRGNSVACPWQFWRANKISEPSIIIIHANYNYIIQLVHNIITPF